MTTWALLGSLSIPILIGIYFLRNRYPEKPVSSLLLWDFPEFKMRKGVHKNKFISERSFWLELLTFIIFLLLLFQIFMPIFKTKQHIVYVLDNRYSLQAKSLSGKMVFEKIVDEIISETQNEEIVSVIIADQYPQLLVANVKAGPALTNALKGWKPESMSFDWQLSKILLTEISDSNTRVVIYSDRLLNNQNDFAGFELRLRGQSQDNLAFINGTFSRSAKAGRLQLVVKGIPRDPAKIFPNIKVTIKQEAFSKEIESTNFDNTNIFSIDVSIPDGNKPVDVFLSEDALVLDNHLHFEPSPNRILKVNLQIQNKELDEIMSKTMRIFDDVLITSNEPDILITDQIKTNLKIPQVVLGLPSNLVEGEGKDFLGKVIMQKDFPLLKDMELNNIRWRGSKKVTAPSTVYLYHLEYPLFGKLLNFEQEVFFWNADLVKSDFRHLQDWPIFWDNLKKYFIKNVDGLKYSTLMGGVENYIVTHENEVDEVKIVSPSQKSIKINVNNHIAVIPPLMERGSYKILAKDKVIASFYVNYFDLDGMNLKDALTKEFVIEGNQKESHRHIKQSGNSHLLIVVLLLVAMGIYCLNLYLDHREETVK